MAYAAFVYDDYYCHGIMDSFAGIYSELEEAKDCLKGGRHERQNMEVMNLETLGIEIFKWLPLYESIETDDKKVLKHRWDESKPQIELQWDGDVRKYGHQQIFFDAGEWHQG